MKQYLKLLFYATAVLLSVSCHKKEPSTCGPDTQHFKYLKTIKNVRADLDRGDSFVLGSLETLFICPYQLEKFVTYENTYNFNQPQRLKYRIWGSVFECRGCPTTSIGYLNFIVIDKIEKID